MGLASTHKVINDRRLSVRSKILRLPSSFWKFQKGEPREPPATILEKYRTWDRANTKTRTPLWMVETDNLQTISMPHLVKRQTRERSAQEAALVKTNEVVSSKTWSSSATIRRAQLLKPHPHQLPKMQHLKQTVWLTQAWSHLKIHFLMLVTNRRDQMSCTIGPNHQCGARTHLKEQCIVINKRDWRQWCMCWMTMEWCICSSRKLMTVSGQQLIVFKLMSNLWLVVVILSLSDFMLRSTGSSHLRQSNITSETFVRTNTLSGKMKKSIAWSKLTKLLIMFPKCIK